MPLKLPSLFHQPSVIIPAIGKSESTDSTIDAKQDLAKVLSRVVTRSPSPTHDSVKRTDIWRSRPSPMCRNGSSTDDESVDMWTIRRCNAFDEEDDISL